MNDLIPIQSQDLIRQKLDFCRGVEMITVTNDAEYQHASELTRQIRQHLKDLDENRKTLVGPLNEQVKEINAAFRDPTEALNNLQTQLTKAVAAYHGELERRRLEEQRRADEAARQERAALEARAKETGQSELAKVAKEIRPSAPPPPPEPAGMHFRTYYSAHVMDLRAFVAWCLTTGNLQYLEPNLTKLNELARATQGQMKIDGVTIVAEKKPAFRG